MDKPPLLDDLVKAMDGLTAGDISMLEASVSSPGSIIATVSGSANDVFWTQLEALGWLRAAELPAGQPDLQWMRCFTLDDAGVASIAALLKQYARKHETSEERDKRMYRVALDILAEVVPTLVEKLNEADCRVKDVAVNLGLLLVDVAKLNPDAEKQKWVLEQSYHVALRRLGL